MNGRREPTGCNVNRARSTWPHVLLSPFLTPGKRLWNSYHCKNWIGLDNSSCIWMLVVYRGAISYPPRHRAHIEAKFWFIFRPHRCKVSATTMSVHATNPNHLKLSFSVEVWNDILTYTLGPFWVIITLWQIRHAYTNAKSCHQFVAHCATDFNCRLWHKLRTSEHINRLECIICSNILYLFSVIFLVECWYNTVFV